MNYFNNKYDNQKSIDKTIALHQQKLENDAKELAKKQLTKYYTEPTKKTFDHIQLVYCQKNNIDINIVEKEFINNTDEFVSTKREYLNSFKWSLLRNKRLLLDNYTCQSCKLNNPPLEMHHLTYENIFNENIEDIISLCRECHQLQHDHYGYRYNKFIQPLI